jgi:general secretion pathway protein D
MYGGGGMYGGGAYGAGMMGGMGSMMGGMYPGMGMSPYGYGGQPTIQQAVAPAGNLANGAPGTIGQTGQYLGPGGSPAPQQMQRGPRVIPNPFDNTLLIQGTSSEYDQILGLLRQLDIPPRQVLIEAKIYEVDLNGDLAAGVSALLEKKDTGSRDLNVATSAAGLALSTGLLVSRTKELLALVNASESTGRSRVISAPSLIATDSVPATMNVGTSVPTLTSQAVNPGVQQSGSSLFTNTISNTSTGVTLQVTARINPSGIVTMVINQVVSAPQAPAASSAIQSPSFQNRSFTTQITVQDGDTVAIGGIITENHTSSSAGVPFLHRIPVLGTAFGAKNTHTDRTELIIFFTPRVIYDSVQLQDATEELKSQLKRVGKLQRDQ